MKTARRKRWERSHEDLVRQHYRRRSIQWLESATGHSASAIRHCAARLGVTATRERRPWTEEDDRLLLQHIDSWTDQRLGRALKRSAEAVRRRRLHHNISAQEARGTLSTGQVAELLDRDESQVREWVRAGKLKRTGKASAHQVRTKDLREFLVANPWAINVRSRGELDPRLVQLLAGQW